MTKELLNKKELSNYLGFSVGKIDNLIKHNKIEYYKIGKNVRFNVNEVKDWVSNFKQLII
jgi:excisionase family DNA binding protein